MIKGFIEVTDTVVNAPRLINIDWIEVVDESWIHLVVSTPEGFSQNVIKCEETYEEIKQKIAEAQQIPNKPIKLKAEQDIKIGAGTWKAGTIVYKCQNCNSFINRSNVYCHNCGQALDWSDEK